MQAEVRIFHTTVVTFQIPDNFCDSELCVEVCGWETRTVHLRNDAL
jgi:hypothetical protein